jgi:cation transport regulator ChaC
MKNYILGYGSLINLKSLSKTLNREVEISELIPVKVNSFKRLWNLKENVYSFELDRNIEAVFLNIEKSNTGWTNGVIFEVSESEFDYLNKRERKYSRIDITNFIEPYTNLLLDKMAVTAYVADDLKYIQDKENCNAYVMKNYIDLVEDGCNEIGTDFLKDYLNSTEDFCFNILGGNYTFV